MHISRVPARSPARSAFHWMLAIATSAAIAVALALMNDTVMVSISTCIAFLVLAAAGLQDLVTGRISNGLTYTAAGIGFGCAALSSAAPGIAPLIGGPDLASAATAFAAVAIVGVVGYTAGGFGAADLKLALALAPLIGLQQLFLTVFVAACMLQIAHIVNRATRGSALRGLQHAARPLLEWSAGGAVPRLGHFRQSRLPMAPGFLIGFILSPLLQIATMQAEWI